MRLESKKQMAVAATVIMVLGYLASAAAVWGQGIDDTSRQEIQAAQAWAFPFNPPDGPQATPPDMNKQLRVPGSQRIYTHAQYAGMLGAPDWFPQDHPPMPQIVARGRKPAWACAYCHLPNGQGRPENAALAALPTAYIVEQVNAFRSGDRNGLHLATVQFMASEARDLSDGDLQLAADYFAKLKFGSRVKVIETATVPKTHWAHFMLAADASGEREPIGNRIIETSTNIKLTELRDARSDFVANVPPGSIARGEGLATKGAGAAPPCVSCHGTKLQGIGAIPPLAGRSPTYLVRELIFFKSGQRTGASTLPMQQEVAGLSVRDMIDAAAYAASRQP